MVVVPACRFLEAALAAQLVWTPTRLLYDAAQVWLHAPLPPTRAIFSVLVAAEWVSKQLAWDIFNLYHHACNNVVRRPGRGVMNY